MTIYKVGDTVSSAEELDALPDDTILRDKEGAWQKCGGRFFSTWIKISLPSVDVAFDNTLTILWLPEGGVAASMIERLEHLTEEYWQMAMDAFGRVNATDGDHRQWIGVARTLLKQWETTTGLVEQLRERERENDDIRHFYSAGGITRPIYDDGGERA